METFTKVWWNEQCGDVARQRTVDEMVAHRHEYGTGGNCFDLALWLRHELQQAGIPARIIGHDLNTVHAHVAVLAEGGDGAQYLCDLGDQWLQPVLITPQREDWSPDWLRGFFPGRDIQITPVGDSLVVAYRHSGRAATQRFDLAVIGQAELDRACHHSQSLIRRPYCEMLLPHVSGSIEHWEYADGRSFWHLESGTEYEAPCASAGEWAARIADHTGMDSSLIRHVIELCDAIGQSPDEL
jgi:hypothetical protein